MVDGLWTPEYYTSLLHCYNVVCVYVHSYMYNAGGMILVIVSVHQMMWMHKDLWNG